MKGRTVGAKLLRRYSVVLKKDVAVESKSGYHKVIREYIVLKDDKMIGVFSHKPKAVQFIRKDAVK